MPKTKNKTDKEPKKLVDIDKLEINGLPEGVKVATMCCSCFLGSKLDLDNIEKYMVLSQDNVLMVKWNKVSIRTLIDVKKPSKRNNQDAKKKESANGVNNFYNSVQFLIKPSRLWKKKNLQSSNSTKNIRMMKPVCNRFLLIDTAI